MLLGGTLAFRPVSHVWLELGWIDRKVPSECWKLLLGPSSCGWFRLLANAFFGLQPRAGAQTWSWNIRRLLHATSLLPHFDGTRTVIWCLESLFYNLKLTELVVGFIENLIVEFTGIQCRLMVEIDSLAFMWIIAFYGYRIGNIHRICDVDDRIRWHLIGQIRIDLCRIFMLWLSSHSFFLLLQLDFVETHLLDEPVEVLAELELLQWNVDEGEVLEAFNLDIAIVCARLMLGWTLRSGLLIVGFWCLCGWLLVSLVLRLALTALSVITLLWLARVLSSLSLSLCSLFSWGLVFAVRLITVGVLRSFCFFT